MKKALFCLLTIIVVLIGCSNPATNQEQQVSTPRELVYSIYYYKLRDAILMIDTSALRAYDAQTPYVTKSGMTLRIEKTALPTVLCDSFYSDCLDFERIKTECPNDTCYYLNVFDSCTHQSTRYLISLYPKPVNFIETDKSALLYIQMQRSSNSFYYIQINLNTMKMNSIEKILPTSQITFETTCSKKNVRKNKVDLLLKEAFKNEDPDFGVRFGDGVIRKSIISIDSTKIIWLNTKDYLGCANINICDVHAESILTRVIANIGCAIGFGDCPNDSICLIEDVGGSAINMCVHILNLNTLKVKLTDFYYGCEHGAYGTTSFTLGGHDWHDYLWGDTMIIDTYGTYDFDGNLLGLRYDTTYLKNDSEE